MDINSGIADLNIEEWRARYPEYSNLSDVQIEDLLVDATDYLENTAQCIIQNLDKRKRLLYLLAAHLAYINYPDAQGNGGSGFVGRVERATEGTVTVDSGIKNAPFGAEFFLQSKYGFEFWQRIRVYVMGFYVSGPKTGCCRL